MDWPTLLPSIGVIVPVPPLTSKVIVHGVGAGVSITVTLYVATTPSPASTVTTTSSPGAEKS